MAEYVPFLYTGVALLLGGFSLYGGYRSRAQMKLIEGTPTVNARELYAGIAEIAGQARPLPDARPVAPFSQAPCAFCRWEIDREQGGKRRKWITVASGDTGPFLVQTLNGGVLVKPDGVTIEDPMVDVATSAFGRDPAPHLKEFLASRNVAFEGWLGANYKMRFREFVLAEGGPVYVLGDAGPDAQAATLQARKATASGLALAKGNAPFLLATSEFHAHKNRKTGMLAGFVIGGGALALGTWLLMRDLGAL